MVMPEIYGGHHFFFLTSEVFKSYKTTLDALEDVRHHIAYREEAFCFQITLGIQEVLEVSHFLLDVESKVLGGFNVKFWELVMIMSRCVFQFLSPLIRCMVVGVGQGKRRKILLHPHPIPLLMQVEFKVRQ